MTEIAADLKLAIEGLSGMMTVGVRAVGAVVVKSVERSWQGLKTVVSAVRRRLKINSADQPDVSPKPRSSAPRDFALGDQFRDFDAAPEMIVVPAGTFLMGSPDCEGNDDERPQHGVQSRSFAVGIAPIGDAANPGIHQRNEAQN